MDNWYSIAGFNDPMSSLSHLVGTVLFFVLSILLLTSGWRSRTTFWFSLQFAVASLFLLSMSFVYHMMEVGSTSRAVMLRLDVAAVFVLIASTFTAIHGMLFTGWRRWAIIAVLWCIAVVGITLRTVFFDSISPVVGVGIFLLMGWFGACSSYLLWKHYGRAAVRPVVVGGLFYTVGAMVHATDRLVIIEQVWGPHETFHLLVLAGLGTHWAYVWSLADGSFLRRRT